MHVDEIQVKIFVDLFLVRCARIVIRLTLESPKLDGLLEQLAAGSMTLDDAIYAIGANKDE